MPKSSKKTADTPSKNNNLGPDLLKAARTGDAEEIKRLLAQGADVNFNPPAGTPLQQAVKAGQLECAKILIRAGADVQFESMFGGSLLSQALKQNHLELAKLLIQAGVKLTGSDFHASPLLMATTENKIDWVKLLLEAGAEVNEKGSVVCGSSGEPEVTEEISGGVSIRTTHVPDPPVAKDATPLIVAARRGHEEITRLLLKAGADTNRTDKEGLSALAWATKGKHSAVVALLQASGVTPLEFPEGSAPVAMLQAATEGNLSRLQELIAKKVDVNLKHSADEAAERSPLICAAEQGQEAAVRLLLDAGADVNLLCGWSWNETQKRTALMHAAQNGHANVVKLLLERKANLNAKDRESDGGGGRTAMHYAAEKGHAEVINILLAAGAKPDDKTRDKNTPLQLAAEAGHLAAVKVLLTKKVDINAIDDMEMTALAHAASEGHTEVVEVLLAAGADPDLKVDEESQPLNSACTSGHDTVVRLLLKAGAKGAKPKGKYRLGPELISAALMGGSKVVKALLDAGADPNAKDDENITALMCAIRTNNFEAIELLLAAGADINAVNDDGESALDIALDGIETDRNRAKLAELLSAKLNIEASNAVETLKNAKPEEDPIVALLKSQGAKLGKSLGKPAKAHVDDDEEVEPARETMPRPDFSKALKSKAYQETLAELERLSQAKAEVVVELGDPEEDEGVPCKGVSVTADQAKDLLAQRKVFLARGCSLIQVEQALFGKGKVKLALLPTPHWREVVLSLGTSGPNFDVMTEDVIKWLEELEKEQPFELTGAAYDWCEGVFLTPIKNSRKLAKKMYEFCPDIVDQGTGTEAKLANELAKKQGFYFWWD